MRSTFLTAALLLVGGLLACGPSTKDPNEPEMVCHSESNTGSNIGRTVCTPKKKKAESTPKNPPKPTPASPPPATSR